MSITPVPSDNDDDFDIYADLPPDIIDISKENPKDKREKECESLKNQVASLQLEVKTLHKTNETLKRDNINLSCNISILLKTATSEVERKDETIAELRRDLDNLVFRRQGKKSTKEFAQAQPSLNSTPQVNVDALKANLKQYLDESRTSSQPVNPLSEPQNSSTSLEDVVGHERDSIQDLQALPLRYEEAKTINSNAPILFKTVPKKRKIVAFFNDVGEKPVNIHETSSRSDQTSDELSIKVHTPQRSVFERLGAVPFFKSKTDSTSSTEISGSITEDSLNLSKKPVFEPLFEHLTTSCCATRPGLENKTLGKSLIYHNEEASSQETSALPQASKRKRDLPSGIDSSVAKTSVNPSAKISFDTSQCNDIPCKRKAKGSPNMGSPVCINHGNLVALSSNLDETHLAQDQNLECDLKESSHEVVLSSSVTSETDQMKQEIQAQISSKLDQPESNYALRVPSPLPALNSKQERSLCADIALRQPSLIKEKRVAQLSSSGTTEHHVIQKDSAFAVPTQLNNTSASLDGVPSFDSDKAKRYSEPAVPTQPPLPQEDPTPLPPLPLSTPPPTPKKVPLKHSLVAIKVKGESLETSPNEKRLEADSAATNREMSPKKSTQLNKSREEEKINTPRWSNENLFLQCPFKSRRRSKAVVVLEDFSDVKDDSSKNMELPKAIITSKISTLVSPMKSPDSKHKKTPLKKSDIHENRLSSDLRSHQSQRSVYSSRHLSSVRSFAHIPERRSPSELLNERSGRIERLTHEDKIRVRLRDRRSRSLSPQRQRPRRQGEYRIRNNRGGCSKDSSRKVLNDDHESRQEKSEEVKTLKLVSPRRKTLRLKESEGHIVKRRAQLINGLFGESSPEPEEQSKAVRHSSESIRESLVIESKAATSAIVDSKTDEADEIVIVVRRRSRSIINLEPCENAMQKNSIVATKFEISSAPLTNGKSNHISQPGRKPPNICVTQNEKQGPRNSVGGSLESTPLYFRERRSKRSLSDDSILDADYIDESDESLVNTDSDDSYNPKKSSKKVTKQRPTKKRRR